MDQAARSTSRVPHYRLGSPGVGWLSALRLARLEQERQAGVEPEVELLAQPEFRMHNEWRLRR
jgi:hypothetical protein